MEMSGEHQIPAPRETVWQALNDPEVLKDCIPGCQSLEKTSDTSFEAKVKAKVGPVSATFTGAVSLSNIDPPNSYTISGEGKGGVAGFAKGGADVRLEDGEAGATRLLYDVKAQVGGKLAQIGSRLIEGTAKKLANEFFTNFAEKLGGGDKVETEQSEDAGAQSDAHHDTHGEHDHAPPPGLSDAELNRNVGRGVSVGVWVTGLLVVVLVLLAIFGLGGDGGGGAAH